MAQPLFDILARNAEFFVAHRSTALDIVVLALIVTVVPPALLLAIELLAGLVDVRARTALHLSAVAFLAALLTLQALKRVEEGQGVALLTLAAVTGALAALLYTHFEGIRTFLTILAPAPLVFLALFLFASPVSRITLSTGEEARAGTTGASAPVVFVVFDELPLVSLLNEDGEIDADRYPNFAELAADSTWFARTLATSGDTTQAVPSILTGRKPDPDRLPFAHDHPNNLFTLLGESHKLRVIEPLTRLCPNELCPDRARRGFVERERRLLSDVGVVYGHVLLPDDLAERLPSISSTWTDFRGTALHDLRNRDEQYRAFVRSIAATREPTLWFIHTLLPHHPWRYLPSGAEYARATLIPGDSNGLWGPDEVLTAQAYQRHLLQVGFVDRLLGELLARLRAAGLYDRSLVVVTADHGVSFRPNASRRSLTSANAAEVGLVPLFVKAPEQRRGRVVTTLVHATDVLPTMADVLDIAIPWRVDGRSGFQSRVRSRELETQLANALRTKTALFAGGLYRVGPRLELLGRRIDDLSVGSANVDSELADPGLFTSGGKSGLSPAHVVGVLEGEGAEPGLDVAVAVNGTIAATARTFSFLGDVRFEAMVPESSFRPDQNDLEVYVITSSGELLKARGRP